MVNYLLNTDELTVLGGPEQLDVNLNVGSPGSRGSLFFAGFPNPNSNDVEFSTTPQLFDIYIINDPSSADYLQAYQYVLQDGSTSWVKKFKLRTEAFVENKIVSFSAGQATLKIDVANLGLENVVFESLVNSFAYFNVQASISNINSSEAPDGTALDHFPIAFSFNVLDCEYDSSGGGDPSEFPLKLPIDFIASELSDGSWSDLEKEVIVHLSVSFVNASEVLANLSGGNS